VITSKVPRICILTAALVAVVLLASPARAQVLYGSIVGTVTDQTTAAVPNATVIITSKETGSARTERTEADGRYLFGNVQPGIYDVKVTAPGFRSLSQNDVAVTVNTVSRVELKLEVGQITETINVESQALLLQTDKADTHSELDSKAVSTLPLPSYRNYQSLINLVPGATPASFQNSLTDTPGRSLRTNINGANGQTNVTRIDGATSVNIWLPHHVGYVAPEETIQTVNITTGSADAEQGMAGGAAITLVTKSGTNELHGSAFEFHDDQHLKARAFFASTKPVSIYNNFGGTIGGRIIKNKLFYFLSFDGTRQKQGATGLFTVPTSDQRAGNFSKYPNIIYDPNTGNADGTGRTAFPNNTIPGGRIVSAAQKLQAFYPAPTDPSATVNNFFATGGPILNRDYYDAKINYNRNEKHQIFGKYGRMAAIAGGQGIFGVAGGPAPGADPGLGDTLIQLGTLGHTYTISPNLLLDEVVGYERQGQSVHGNDFGKNFGDQLGIPGLNGPDIRQSGFPNTSLTTYTGFGVPNWMPLTRIEESITTSHNLTWTRRAHEFRVGFDLVRHRLNHWQPELSAGGPRGYLQFGGGQTAQNGGAAPNQYNSYAAFLLGIMDNIQKGQQYILMTGREWQLGWYLRDRWQVSRKLTLNLGVRYEFYPLMTRAAGKGLERLDPETNLVYLGGRANVPVDAGFTVSHKLFSPRVGLAYRLDENTVLRTGYGLNYDPIPFSRPLRGFYPLTINYNLSSLTSFQTIRTLDQGIPPEANGGPDLSTGIVSLPATADERSPRAGLIHRGYTQSWNFSLERRLPMDLVLTTGYVGTQSVHLLADFDINAGQVIGAGASGRPYFARFGRNTATNMWDGYLSSHYHALQVALNKRFTRGLLVKGAYTWSKAIDMADDDGWVGVSWNAPQLFSRNRSIAGFDRAHVFQIGWVYELPFGTGKKYANSGVAKYVIGNWQVNGVMAAYTGTPFTVGSGSALNMPGNSQTANQVNPIVTRIGGVGPGAVYYDPTAFAAGPSNTLGNTGRDILRNPGVWNTDLSLFRVFRVMEKRELQFRGEFFNFPNTSHFNGPSSSVTSTNFMQITSAFGERQIRFGLKLQF
jgi:outer membrane receptor protein involved in Fe transport